MRALRPAPQGADVSKRTTNGDGFTTCVAGPLPAGRTGCETGGRFPRKAEEEVRAVLDHLSAQDEALTKIVETLATKMNGTAQAG